jgi:Na+/proline symporter
LLNTFVFFHIAVEVGLHTVVLNKVISYLMYNKSTFPRVFHMWSCIQWSFGGNRVVGLNGLPVILPRVMHISTDRAEKVLSSLSPAFVFCLILLSFLEIAK